MFSVFVAHFLPFSFGVFFRQARKRRLGEVAASFTLVQDNRDVQGCNEVPIQSVQIRRNSSLSPPLQKILDPPMR